MENIVTAKTALALKRLGFKQLKPERGQSWYTINDTEIIVTGCKGEHVFCATKDGEYVVEIDVLHFGDFAYAATATDILWWLGQDWTLDADWAKQEWLCWAISSVSKSTFRHKNPAEAAALAWLEKYAK